jgi:hypothetical protein
MSKSTKAAVATPAATPAVVTLYRVVAPKRPLHGTKHGNGTAKTHQALCDAANADGRNGLITFADAQAVTKAAGDPGFAAYAVRRLKVLVAVSP